MNVMRSNTKMMLSIILEIHLKQSISNQMKHLKLKKLPPIYLTPKQTQKNTKEKSTKQQTYEANLTKMLMKHQVS